MPTAGLVPKPIRIGAAVVVIAAMAYITTLAGAWWFELPAVVLIPVVWWVLVHLPERSHGLARIPFDSHPGDHRVTLRAPGADRKQVVYVVVCSLGVGIGEADRLMSRVPTDLVSGVSADVASEFAYRLQAAGAGVTIGPT